MESNQPEPTFEDYKNTNGKAYWWASELLLMFGYVDMKSFGKVLDRTTKAFISLGISHHENIIPQKRAVGGKESDDFKLSRFACYLSAMNADPKKTEVARAQAYFAKQTRKFELFAAGEDRMERLLTRDELTEGNKSLASVVKNAGVDNYARFQNAGYLGMYNMPNWKLAKKRGIESKNLLDHMGRTELAANLFRVTQTEERIKNRGIKGQEKLEKTHRDVGGEVRKIMAENTGSKPENLPQAEKIPEVRKGIKKSYKEISNQDK